MMRRLLATDRMLAAAIPTPETQRRDRARSMVRSEIGRALAEKLGAGEGTIPLISQPGHPIRLAPPWSHVGISVSHEAGLSVMAIRLDGPIGIDLLRLGPAIPDIPALSRDYLGPAMSDEIAAQAMDRQGAAFARAWCRFEAKLKCLGLPLREWDPELDRRLAGCSVADLPIGPGWAAAIATPHEQN